MKIICSNNPTHTEFSATVHVTQEWKVDENGVFLETLEDCVETLKEPNAHDHFNMSAQAPGLRHGDSAPFCFARETKSL